jgi:hypothetical protein
MSAACESRLKRTTVMMLVYDCEIIKAIQGKGESKLEGIEYCSGWRDFSGMGISCIGAYDYVEGRYRMFLEDNFSEFQALLNSRKVLVGFNSISFDNLLISANGFTIPAETEQYDILVEVWKAAGLAPEFKYPSHIGYGLADCCKCNFGTGKTGSGGSAPVEWQRGEFGKVIDYCLNDVKLTVQLLQQIMLHGELKNPKNGDVLKMRLP